MGGSGWEWVEAQFSIIIQNFRNIFSKSTSCGSFFHENSRSVFD